MYEVKCHNCKVLFKTWKEKAKYCSKSCFREHYRKKNPQTEKNCKQCGVVFFASRKRNSFCSEKCALLFRYNKDHFEEYKFDSEPWSVIKIYGAGNLELPTERRPSFALGF